MSQPNDRPDPGELHPENGEQKPSHASDHRSGSEHRSSGSGHSSHHSSGSEHSSHRSSDSGHSSHHSSDSSSSSHRSSDSASSSHHSSDSGHSSHHSSDSSSSSHSSSGSASSSHRSSDSEHSSHHVSSRGNAQRESERKRRDALIDKYHRVSQDDIVSEESHTHHRHHHRRRRSRRRTVKRILIAVASTLLALVLIFGGTFAILHQIGKKQIQTEAVGVQENPFSVTYDEGNTVEYNGGVYELNRNLVTVAAIGVDREEFGLQDEKIGTAGQADMVMLLVMDLDTGSVRGILIPRDTMVDVDLYTVDGQYVGVDNMQICLSFAYGDGEQTSAKNVLTSVGRLLYGIPLALYGAMDLDGIAALNDAIGGITVTLQDTYEYKTETYTETHVAGETLTLHGQDAQSFVRSRDTSQLNSDEARRARQMQYLNAFVEKVSGEARQDIGVIRRLYNVALQYAFTNMSLAKVTYLATTLLSKGAAIGEIITLPGELTDADPYPEYHLNEQAVFEAVLDVFYTRVN